MITFVHIAGLSTNLFVGPESEGVGLCIRTLETFDARGRLAKWRCLNCKLTYNTAYTYPNASKVCDDCLDLV